MIQSNFAPDHLYKDVTTRDHKRTPNCDVYIAGFPCQPFSTAGKQQGFSDTKGRGTVFFDILQYITTKRPKVFILENVKGLVTTQNGAYLNAILHELQSIGLSNNSSMCAGNNTGAYHIYHQILDTKEAYHNPEPDGTV